MISHVWIDPLLVPSQALKSPPASQMGPDFLLVDAPFDHPPGDASVVLQVDQSERRWNVHLPDGISAESKRVAITVSV